MQDDTAVKRSLSVWFFSNSLTQIAMASFKKVQELLCLCLIEEIIDRLEANKQIFDNRAQKKTNMVEFLDNWKQLLSS